MHERKLNMDPNDNYHTETHLPNAFYQPEMVLVQIMDIRNALDCLEAGIDHTTELLAQHDIALGRTTMKNKTWAEVLEANINQMTQSKQKLAAYLK